MTVFRIYAKLVRANVGIIIIYLVIFAGMSLLASGNISTSQPDFELVQVPIVWVDEDNTELTRGLKNYVEQFATFIPADNIHLDDAFFYREIQGVYIIPEGFTSSLLLTERNKIESRWIENSFSSHTIRQAINRYCNLAYIYQTHMDLEDDLIATIEEQLANVPIIEYVNVETIAYRGMHFFYNTLAYVLLALIITIIGTTMLPFKPMDMKRRNDIGMISNQKMNVYLFLGNIILGLFFLIAFYLISIILYPNEVLSTRGLWIMINGMFFTIAAIALAYMIAVLFNSRNMITAMGTVVSLGGGFITGVFIPQMFLDPNILTVAQIIPSFWYIKANDHIVFLNQFNVQTLDVAIRSMVAQLVLASIFITLALLVARKRRQNEQ